MVNVDGSSLVRKEQNYFHQKEAINDINIINLLESSDV